MSTLPQAAEQRVSRSFLVDSAGSAFFTGLGLVIRFATSILIARFLGPAGKGVIALIQLLLGQASAFLGLGLDTAIVHFIGRRNWPAPTVASRTLGLSIVLGALGFSVLFLLQMTLFAGLITSDLRPVFLLMAATVPLTLATMCLRAILRACGGIIEESYLNTISSLAILAGISAAVLASAGVRGVLWGLFAATLVGALANFAVAARMGILRGRPVFDLPGTRPLVNFGVKLHLGNILASLNQRFDLYIVGFFVGTAGVGIYSVSVVMGELLWILPGVLSAVLMQRVATRSDAGANAIMGPVNRMTSLILFAGILAVAAAGDFIIRLLFGAAFAPAYLPLLLLLPGIWAFGLWRNLMNDLAVRGFPLYKTYTAGAAVVVTIVLDFILIPLWGVPGAAVASTVAYWVGFLMALHYYRRVTGFSLRQILIPARGDFSLAYGLLRRRTAGTRNPVDDPRQAQAMKDNSGEEGTLL
jgi:stage V sporulation protein B